MYEMYALNPTGMMPYADAGPESGNVAPIVTVFAVTPVSAVAAARVASDELGFKVVGLGTYSREFAREVREAAKRYGIEALITDDYLEVEAKVAELQPELVLGTQMERHIAKR